VRRAIGASRGNLVRQLFTESVILAATGGVLALVVAYWMSAALLSFLPAPQMPALANLRFEADLRVLAFAGFLSLGTCLLFGLIPALRATRPPNRYRSRSWMSRGLVICEVAVCTLLLVVAGLFVRTVQNLRGQDAGYQQENRVLVADIGVVRCARVCRRAATSGNRRAHCRRRAAARRGMDDPEGIAHTAGGGIRDRCARRDVCEPPCGIDAVWVEPAGSVDDYGDAGRALCGDAFRFVSTGAARGANRSDRRAS